MGKQVETGSDFILGGSRITADGDCSHEIRKRLLLGRKVMINLDSVDKQRPHSANKGPYSQGCGLLSGHIWLWELDCKEGRAPKNWCLWTVVLENSPTCSGGTLGSHPRLLPAPRGLYWQTLNSAWKIPSDPSPTQPALSWNFSSIFNKAVRSFFF